MNEVNNLDIIYEKPYQRTFMASINQTKEARAWDGDARLSVNDCFLPFNGEDASKRAPFFENVRVHKLRLR